MRKLTSIVLLLFAAPTYGSAHQTQGPVTPQLLQARSAYVHNMSGHPQAADRVYLELVRWGRFQLVGDIAAADVAIVIDFNATLAGIAS